MTTLDRGDGWLWRKGVLLSLAALLWAAPAVRADDWTKAAPGRSGGPGYGTLGYGPDGVMPGFQGFGLGYHPGYGYGGHGLGVGADGGYPYYAGPGYPHCPPVLRRRSGIDPFAYFAGPGYPTPDHPNYFAPPGPLVGDQPVVIIHGPGYDGDYGGYSGGPPNAEALYAPFATSAAAGGSARGVESVIPAPSNLPPMPPTEPDLTPAPTQRPPGLPPAPSATNAPLGIETQPVVVAEGTRGLQVSKVNPGTAAARAGLASGDVIVAMNGYVTVEHGNLEWIIAHASTDRVLKMDVRSGRNGKIATLTAELPVGLSETPR